MNQLNNFYNDPVYYQTLNSSSSSSSSSSHIIPNNYFYIQPQNKFPIQYYDYNGNINNISNNHSFFREQLIMNEENKKFSQTDHLVHLACPNSYISTQSPTTISMGNPNQFTNGFNQDVNCKDPPKYYYHHHQDRHLPLPFVNNSQFQQTPGQIIYNEKASPHSSPLIYNKVKNQNFVPDLTINTNDTNFNNEDKVQTKSIPFTNNNKIDIKRTSLVDNGKASEFEDTSNLIPIPGYMAYSHPFIPMIPSATGNNKNQLKILFEDEYMKNNNQNNYIKNEKLQSQIKIISAASPMWTSEEDKLLKKLKEEHKLGWRDISMYFPSRTLNACQFRWRRLIEKGDKRLKRELVKLERINSNKKTTKCSKSSIKRIL